MIEKLNTIAMVVGYGTIAYAALWLVDERRKEKWEEHRRKNAKENAASWQRFKDTNPDEWAKAEEVREGRSERNEIRRSKIAELKSEMEEEL